MRAALFLSALTIASLSIGCSYSYDEESLAYIENYSAEIIPAVEAALVDLELWLESPGPDDEELLDRLQEHADMIREINYRYWTEEMPEDTVIEKWKITRERNGETWRIKGHDLTDALYLVGANSDALAGAMEMVVTAGGELSEQELEWVTEVVEEAKRAIGWLGWILK